MPYQVIPFCGQSYQDKTLYANAQESINLYPMRTKIAQYSDKKIGYALPEQIIMYPTPGYKWGRNVGNGQIRALFVINTVIYFICGNQLLSFTPTGGGNDITMGTVNTLGTLNTSIGLCSIECNNVQLAISDGSFGYTYNLNTTVFAQIGSSGSFPASGGVTNFSFIDGYILAAKNNSLTVIQSNVLDATTWGSQAFDTITSFPDNIVGVFSNGLQFYVMGPKVTEVQGDAGTIPYAFEKITGVLILAGLAALHSICKVGSTFMFLASDPHNKAYVAVMNGYEIDVVSTPPMNEAMERYAAVNDAYAYSYREGDNLFYIITFPTANVTWAYEVTTKMWHKRSINGGADLPLAYVLWQGQHIVGDANGNLYIMSQNYSYYSQYIGGIVKDYPLSRVRTTAHLNDQGKSIFINELWVDMQVGSGFITDSNLATQPTAPSPLATLEVSKDYGNTWTVVGTKSLGVQGNYTQRVIWRRLGRFRQNATFRLTVTDPLSTYILGAKADIRAGVK